MTSYSAGVKADKISDKVEEKSTQLKTKSP